MIPSAPLAESIRPTALDKSVGQKHLAAKGAVPRKLIEKGMIPSMILWGSPGIRKTTLAHIIFHN